METNNAATGFSGNIILVWKSIGKRLTDPSLKWPITIFLVGVLIRIILMPFAVHIDMLSATWREHFLAFASINQAAGVIEYLTSLYVCLAKPLLHSLPDILDPLRRDPGEGSVSYAIFVQSADAMRSLFILKLPYLIADIFFAVFVWKAFGAMKNRSLALILWAFNPFLIYAVYLWGRYDIFPILFSFMAFYFAKKELKYFSLISILIAVYLRISFVIFLPFFLIYYWEEIRRWWKYILAIIILAVVFSKGMIFAYVGGSFLDYALKGQFGNGFNDVGLLVIVFPLVLFFFYKNCLNNRSFQKLVYFSLIGIIAFYALSYFHPHYIAWITAPLLFAIVLSRRILWPTIILAAVYFILVDVYFGPARTIGLFSPLNPGFFGTVSGLTDRFFLRSWNPDTLITLFHSLFVAILAAIAFILYKGKDLPNENK